MSASAVLRRLERGERCWPAEIGLRGAGGLLLVLCVGLGGWLYRSLHLTQGPAGVLHYSGATLAVLCWSLGWALLAEGPGLFRSMPRPPRTVFRGL